MKARRGWAIVVALTLAVVCGADQQARERATELVRESQRLVDAGENEEALGLLLEALEIDPDSPRIHSHLGYLYELDGRTLQALKSYGRLLELRPDDEYGRERVRHLYLAGEFPRRLRLDLLQFSPVSFVVDTCRIATEASPGELTRRIAHTTGVVFPDGMKETGEPITVTIPSAGGQGVTGEARFNRTAYGFVAVPEGEELRMTVRTHYPSPLLSEEGNDYADLAESITHLMLRMYCYSRGSYGFPSATEEQIPRLLLCESGPTGAEHYDNDIFFYDVGRGRRPEEWLRQIAHEWGHHALPRMASFSAPEPDAAGVLGELLFLQHLANEAAMVAGDKWPSERAQAAIDGLWGDGEVALCEQIESLRERTIDLWLREGPNSELAAGLDEEAFYYLVGAMGWIDAAHGPRMLRSTLLNAPGESPADFYYGYRQAVREAAADGEIVLNAGAIDLWRSELAEPPREGALRREDVILTPGDRADYPVYLLDGPATVRVTPGLRQVKLNLYVDDVGPLPVEGGASVSLGQRDQGWHTLTLVNPDDGEAVELDRLILTTGEAEQPAPGL